MNVLHIDPEKPLFLIWYASLDRATQAPYSGSHLNQVAITEEEVNRLQGIVPSAAGLAEEMLQLKHQNEQELNKLRTQVESYRSQTKWFMATVLPLVIVTISVVVMLAAKLWSFL